MKNQLFAEKILITGGAGFIGSFLAQKLINKGHSVVVVDDLSTGSRENVNQLLNSPTFSFYQENICDFSELIPIVKQCDLVVHLAAYVGVQFAIKQPTELFMNNIISGEKVLNACYKCGKPIFFASSSEVYGKQIRDKLSEGDYSYVGSPEMSRWIYSLSKLSEEFMAYDYYRKGLKVIAGRFFNFIGTNQSSRYGMVVPKFINQALKNEKITVYGDGSQSRTYCDVDDGTDAIISLLQLFNDYEALSTHTFNIGANKSTTIIELAELIKKLTNSQSEIEFISFENMPDGFDEIMQRNPDTSLLKSITGWQPKWTLQDTLLKIINSREANND